MATITQSNYDNFLTWQKVNGTLTLEYLQRNGLPEAIETDILETLITSGDIISRHDVTYVSNVILDGSNNIQTIKDTAGGDSPLTQATTTQRPAYTGGVAVFDGSDDELKAAADVFTGLTAYSMYFVFKRNNTTTDKMICSGASSSNYVMYTSTNGISLRFSGTEKYRGEAGIGTVKYIILGIRRNGTSVSISINDRILIQKVNTLDGTHLGDFGTIFGWGGGSGFNMAANFKMAAISNTYISDTNHLKIVNQLYSDYNLGAITTTDVVIGFGDSNTVGQGVTPYLDGLATSLGVVRCNLGLSGTPFTNYSASPNNGYERYETQLVTRPYSDYVVVQYGTNDIAIPVTAANFGVQYADFVNKLVNTYGYDPNKICLCSVPYQLAGANATTLNDYRTVILNTSTTYGTKYYDLLQAMRDNGADTLLSDTVHLNAAGQALWQAGVLAALTT